MGPLRDPAGRDRVGRLGLVRPRRDVDLVTLGVGQRPPLGRVLVVDHVTTGGERRRNASLRLVVRHVDIDWIRFRCGLGASICWNQNGGPSVWGSKMSASSCSL